MSKKGCRELGLVYYVCVVVLGSMYSADYLVKQNCFNDKSDVEMTHSFFVYMQDPFLEFKEKICMHKNRVFKKKEKLCN